MRKAISTIIYLLSVLLVLLGIATDGTTPPSFRMIGVGFALLLAWGGYCAIFNDKQDK